MKNAVRYLRPAGAISSVALFACLLQRTRLEVILDNIRLLGLGLVVLILLSGVRQILRALAWSYCVPSDGPRLPALQLLGPRLVGEALNDLTPAGPLLGEPAKVLAVSKLVPAQAGASSVVIENLIFALGSVFFMSSGAVLALLALTTGRASCWIVGGLIIGVLACIAMVYWSVSRRVSFLSLILAALKQAGVRWAFLDRHEQSLRGVEHTICNFFLKSRRTFLAVLALEIATNFTGIAEAYLILKVTAPHTSLFAAYLVESASRAAQAAFSFVPLGLGVQEGALAATLRSVGYGASEGISLAVIRRIRTLFWAALGLLFLVKYSIVFPTAERSITCDEATHC